MSTANERARSLAASGVLLLFCVGAKSTSARIGLDPSYRASRQSAQRLTRKPADRDHTLRSASRHLRHSGAARHWLARSALWPSGRCSKGGVSAVTQPRILCDPQALKPDFQGQDGRDLATDLATTCLQRNCASATIHPSMDCRMTRYAPIKTPVRRVASQRSDCVMLRRSLIGSCARGLSR